MHLCLKAQLKAPKADGSLKRDFTFKSPSVLIHCSLPRKVPNRLHLTVHENTHPLPDTSRESPTTTAGAALNCLRSRSPPGLRSLPSSCVVPPDLC